MGELLFKFFCVGALLVTVLCWMALRYASSFDRSQIDQEKLRVERDKPQPKTAPSFLPIKQGYVYLDRIGRECLALAVENGTALMQEIAHPRLMHDIHASTGRFHSRIDSPPTEWDIMSEAKETPASAVSRMGGTGGTNRSTTT